MGSSAPGSRGEAWLRAYLRLGCLAGLWLLRVELEEEAHLLLPFLMGAGVHHSSSVVAPLRRRVVVVVRMLVAEEEDAVERLNLKLLMLVVRVVREVDARVELELELEAVTVASATKSSSEANASSSSLS